MRFFFFCEGVEVAVDRVENMVLDCCDVVVVVVVRGKSCDPGIMGSSTPL